VSTAASQHSLLGSFHLAGRCSAITPVVAGAGWVTAMSPAATNPDRHLQGRFDFLDLARTYPKRIDQWLVKLE